MTLEAGASLGKRHLLYSRLSVVSALFGACVDPKSPEAPTTGALAYHAGMFTSSLQSPGRRILLVLLALVVAGCAEEVVEVEPQSSSAALRLGALFDQTGALGEFGRSGESGLRLAVHLVNQAGGVLGQPVEVVLADGATDTEVTVTAATQLIEADGVHAIVGPLGSAAAIAVVEQVTAERRIPTISPTATSPRLSHIADDGFFFRSTASDAAQAPVLADLATRLGFQRVAVLYRDDAYGRDLFQPFQTAFPGEVVGIAIDPERDSYVEELRQAADAGAQAVVAMTFVPAAARYVKQAVEHGLFDQFLFTDGTASIDLVDAVGAEVLQGMKGTAAEGTVPTLTSSGTQDLFTALYSAAYDQPPVTGLEAAAFDIAICICLAAERAGSIDGVLIRDALTTVCGGDGVIIEPGQETIAAALKAVRAGQSINYDGASSTMDWDANGDLKTGLISIWEFSAGAIVGMESVPFES